MSYQEAFQTIKGILENETGAMEDHNHKQLLLNVKRLCESLLWNNYDYDYPEDNLAHRALNFINKDI